MLKLNVGKGRQVIKLLHSIAILHYSGRARGVCALQSSSYMYVKHVYTIHVHVNISATYMYVQGSHTCICTLYMFAQAGTGMLS